MTSRLNAAIYCRISRDPEGLHAGVDRQREDCLALAKRDHLNVVGTYIDNDLSASTLSRKPRPQFNAMIEAARRGDVDVIVAYSNSRLTRRLMELEGLIQLHDSHGTRIITVVSGQDDLSTADGRMVARIKASVDSAEAERTGERIRRAHLQRARSGATNHGGRPFGWAPDKLALDTAEAAVIVAAVEQVINGIPLRAIARDWNSRGIRTSRDGEWNHTTLRRFLQRPRLAGWRTHHGAIVTDPSSGAPVRGEWAPLLDQDTFDRLQTVLARNVRGGARRGARKYVLTGVIRCGTCGNRMNGSRTKSGHAYTCSREPADHSVTITGPQTEQAVIEVVKARLAKEKLDAPEPARPPGVDRAEQIPGLIAELMSAFNAGRLSGAVVFGQVEQLEAELAELGARRARYISATAIPATVSAEHLEDLDDDRLRAVIETVLEAVVVQPASRRGEPWTPDRLSYVWKQP